MALLLVSAGVKAGKKAYKAYDNKQKQKKEKELKDNQGQDSPDLSRVELNDPSYPSLSTTSQIVPQDYVTEKKSREYEDHKDLNDNPFEVPPPSYQKALQEPSSAPTAYGGGFGPSEYTPRRRGSTSSSSSSSSSSSDNESHTKKGLSKSEYRDLRRRDKYERRLARRQQKDQRRADKAQMRYGGMGGGFGGGPARIGGLGLDL
ncbi:hypothetical protein V866_002556 [Kwoniella sp. B9012]